MKKIVGVVFILLFLSSNIFGQNKSAENILAEKKYSCGEVNLELSYLIPEYYNKNEIDSIFVFVEYLNKNCDKTTELSQRIKILLSIENSTFSEHLYDSTIIDNLLLYKGKIYGIHSGSSKGYNFTQDRYNQKPLIDFTQNLSVELLKSRNNLSVLEKFFLDFYANNKQSLKELKSNDYKQTRLAQYYSNNKKKELHKLDVHAYIKGGFWIPQNNLSAIRNHPDIGGALGISFGSFYSDIVISYRWGNIPETYPVVISGNFEVNSNKFSFLFFGIDLGFRLYSKKYHGIDLLGGLAFEKMDIFETERNFFPDGPYEPLKTNNINVGIGYKYQFNSKGAFVGLDLKYHFVDFVNKLGADLTGNAITINVLFGYGKLWNH